MVVLSNHSSCSFLRTIADNTALVGTFSKSACFELFSNAHHCLIKIMCGNLLDRSLRSACNLGRKEKEQKIKGKDENFIPLRQT